MRVDRFVLDSAALRDNPLRDPSEREVLVLLPPGYDDGERRFPLLILLAGYTGFGAKFLQRECWDEALDQRLARLFAQGCPPAVVALPDCCTKYGGSQYVNSDALGRYADHVVREVVPAVESRYRVIARPEGRAVLGKSSGGFGALHLVMEHPGFFGAAACHSGDMGFELSFAPGFPVCADLLGRAGGVKPFLAGFFRKPKRSPAEFTAIETIAMAAAWSPNPASPDGFDLPFDLATCELRHDVFDRWRAFDPVNRVEANAAALRSLALLFVDCGSRDEHQLHFGARRFARECRAHGVALAHEEFDDGHRGTSYRWDVSIPKVLQAMAERSGVRG